MVGHPVVMSRLPTLLLMKTRTGFIIYENIRSNTWLSKLICPLPRRANHPPDGRLLQIRTDEMGDGESAEGSWTSASEGQRPLRKTSARRSAYSLMVSIKESQAHRPPASAGSQRPIAQAGVPLGRIPRSATCFQLSSHSLVFS